MDNPSITFIPATPEDSHTLAEIRILAMRDSLQRIGRFDPQRAKDRFTTGFEPKDTRHIMHGVTRVGFVVLRHGPEHLLLDHLYIHPDHQNRGHGSAVLQLLFAEADAKGAVIRVGALRESDSNRFYARHGFELTEQTEWDNYFLRHPNR